MSPTAHVTNCSCHQLLMSPTAHVTNCSCHQLLMSPTSLFFSILCMCPYQRSLISLTFSLMLVTPSSFLMSTLYFVSQCYTFNSSQPLIIPVFSRICSSFFLTVQHSAPYRSTGLMTLSFVCHSVCVVYANLQIKNKTPSLNIVNLTTLYT